MDQQTRVLFSGTFERSMDVKKRVAVPASWLSNPEGEIFHVIPHPRDGYLMMMPPAEFDRWEAEIMASDRTASEKRMAVRKFYGEAHTVGTDRQGRVLLPEKHCERAGLTTEAIFVGGGRRFEIWSAERYIAADAIATAAYESVAESIGL